MLERELRSENTLPLLNFLTSVSPDHTTEQLTETFHAVTAGVGEDPPPLPVDESDQDKAWLLKLMKEGPPPPKGSSKVSRLPRVAQLALSRTRLPSSVLVCPGYPLGMN